MNINIKAASSNLGGNKIIFEHYKIRKWTWVIENIQGLKRILKSPIIKGKDR